MLFAATKLAGAYLIDIEPARDERGFFARTFCEREFAAHGLPTRFAQCNLSSNRHSKTLRGMHYQAASEPEAKLVRCVRGAICDVIIDLRANSSTCFEWIAVELSADNARSIYVPAGFAHGFITLEDHTEVYYHMSDFFNPTAARGLRWDDPRFAIHWPVIPEVISERDANYPDFDAAR